MYCPNHDYDSDSNRGGPESAKGDRMSCHDLRGKGRLNMEVCLVFSKVVHAAVIALYESHWIAERHKQA